MKAEAENFNCGRKEDLISFLYDEMNDGERAKFVKHTESCAECRAEVSSFSAIRNDVISWRDATLGATTPLVIQPAIDRVASSQRSAMAALREFFNLSPLWMKGAVAFASLLFCVLVVLVVMK